MLLGKQVRLRAIERDDLPTFVRWLNDPDVRQYLAMYAPLSLVEEERWFESQLDDKAKHVFAIEALAGKDATLIGITGLHHIDWKNGSAELGICIGQKNYWGQGYGTEAIRVMLRFAFREMNLHRVQLDVYDFNARAASSYEKAGFRREGTRRQAFFRDGRYRDVHVMGVLREEFVDEESK